MTTRPGEPDRAGRMQVIRSELARALASDPDVRIDALPEDQLFVSKHFVDAGGSRTGKNAQRVPAEDGFTLYVRIVSTDAEARPSQRSKQSADNVVSDAATTTLKLDRTALDQGWQLGGIAGERFVVTVRCGSAAVFDEVDRVLDALSRALAR